MNKILSYTKSEGRTSLVRRAPLIRVNGIRKKKRKKYNL